MLTLTVADLVHRRRQFLIAVLGTALVLGMAMVMSGMSNSFRQELRTTVDDVGADRWLVAEGVSGPTTGFAPLPSGTVAAIRDRPDVAAADGLVFLTQTVTTPAGHRQANLWAHEPGGLGTPTVVAGRAPEASGEIVVDGRLGVDVGERVVVAGREALVVGRTEGHSMFGGIPNAYVPLADAQSVLFGGADIVTIVAVAGDVDEPPAGVQLMTNDQVQRDSLRTMRDAIESVDTTRLFMWAVAVVIVAGLMFVSALERARDFAVAKAIGVSSAYLFASQALQAVIVAAVAAALGIAIAHALEPTFALPIAMTAGAYLSMPVVAVVVGLLASFAGLRRAVTADPALAFS